MSSGFAAAAEPRYGFAPRDREVAMGLLTTHVLDTANMTDEEFEDLVAFLLEQK